MYNVVLTPCYDFYHTSKADGRDSAAEVSVPVVKDLHPIYQNNAKTFLSGPLGERHKVNPLKLDGPFECLLFVGMREVLIYLQRADITFFKDLLGFLKIL